MMMMMMMEGAGAGERDMGAWPFTPSPCLLAGAVVI
jgi:hypothetical protein